MLFGSVLVLITLALLGLVLGSFAGATVWRLRARQLRLDAAAGEKAAKAERRQVEKLEKRPLSKDRSVCLHCGHPLGWRDLIPLVSWLSLRGKCRYCHKAIGRFEPLMELGLATFFVVSYAFWPVALAQPVDVLQFAIWLVAGFGLAILFAYDAKWFLLPNVVTFPLIGLGAFNAVLVVTTSPIPVAALFSVLMSCVVLSGLYYVIYVLSRHQWVGFGDVKLGLALALLLANWQLAVIALFLANLVGTLVFLPQMLTGTMKRHSHIPFGPLLIIGWALAGIFGMQLLQWYVGIVL